MRRYAAIEFSWDSRPEDADIERLMADVDDGSLSGVEDQELTWRAFFDTARARDRVLASLGPLPSHWQVRAVDVDDEGWAERSQASIGPVRVGRLVVTPPWRLADPVAAEPGVDHVIVINPSMGFGTGHHASTRLSLSLLQTVALDGRRVIDIGTGSGVLALAARALGASGVDAVDNDADALMSARENVRRNGADGDVRLIEADLGALVPAAPTHDVVMANLTGATLGRHAADLAGLCRPGGTLVASGLETGEVESVTAAMTEAGWRLVSRAEEEGWVGLLFERTATSPTGSRDS